MTDRELSTVKSDDVATETNGDLREFWINELEVAYDQVLEQAIQSGFMDEWLEKHNGRQIDILRINLGMTGAKTGRGKLKAKKDELRSDDDELLPYVLVKEFARFKSKLATIEAARRILPPNVMDICAKGDDDYDTLALCYAIYHHDARQLGSVLHLDRIHKTGFARMKMKGGPRRPNQQFKDYLKRETVEQLLGAFDKSKADGRTSSFKNIIIDDDHCHVFIRRCEKPSLILRGSEVVHGHRPEWIVLQFFDGAKRVNISSLSVSDSLEIANRIASDLRDVRTHFVEVRERRPARLPEVVSDRSGGESVGHQYLPLAAFFIGVQTMSAEVYRYTFASSVPFEEVESSLVLAIMAAESLHGQPQVRLDAAHAIDSEKHSCVIDASTYVGRDLNRLFIGFINREFGPDAFTVERIEDHDHQPQEAAA